MLKEQMSFVSTCGRQILSTVILSPLQPRLEANSQNKNHKSPFSNDSCFHALSGPLYKHDSALNKVTYQRFVSPASPIREWRATKIATNSEHHSTLT